jgi:hypothetical protein
VQFYKVTMLAERVIAVINDSLPSPTDKPRAAIAFAPQYDTLQELRI